MTTTTLAGMTRKQIGAALRKARKAAGLSYRAASAAATTGKVGITLQQISDMETAAKNYTVDSLIAYARALGMQVELHPRKEVTSS